jgi:ribose transport system substrate-binding protein
MRHTVRRWFISCAAVIAVAAVLAACSSSSAGSGNSAPAASAGTASQAAARTGQAKGAAFAEQMVAKYEAITTHFPVPSASVSGVSKFKGRTVYYIPLVAAGGLPATGANIKQALAVVGLKTQICYGQAQPSVIAGCVTQAEGANAAGIILDAIPYGMAANALNGAKAKGIPIIITDQYVPPGTVNNDQETLLPGVVGQPTQIAWWMIADSDGTANALIAEEDNEPSEIQDLANSLPIYQKYCPDCKITVIKISAAAAPTLLASNVGSTLLSHPDVKYYYTEYEDSLQPTLQGIQQANRSSSLTLSTAAGSVFSMGLLKTGSLVRAVSANDSAYGGWALADEILRMMTKSPPVPEPIPSRLFTSQNIGSVQVTAAAEASGAWFGGTPYQAAFEKLWGVG